MAQLMTRRDFEAEVRRLWPMAHGKPLIPELMYPMWVTYRTLGVSPSAIVAGFADACKSHYKR